MHPIPIRSPGVTLPPGPTLLRLSQPTTSALPQHLRLSTSPCRPQPLAVGSRSMMTRLAPLRTRTQPPGISWAQRLAPPARSKTSPMAAVYTADGSPDKGPTHVTFKLAPEEGMIGLSLADLTLVDSVIYGPQTTDISQGRSPNGSTNYAFFTTPTPGSPNPGPVNLGGQIVINEVFANNVSIVESDGSTPDWVELYNPASTNVNIGDMSLSDLTTLPRRYIFAPGT